MAITFKYSVDSSATGKADYEITEKNLIIKNVPLTGEIVQDYFDSASGKDLKAYKPLDEIKKIAVDRVPITFLHPERDGVRAIDSMPTEIAADEVYGYMTKPSLTDKNGIVYDDKLYADLVYFRGSDMVNILEEKLKLGEGVDVSIGFKYKTDETEGTFKGQKYDYVQRSIKLDHLATLIDSNGIVQEGRASYQAGYGIGNDTKDKMGDEKLIQDNADLQVQVSKLETQAADSKTAFDSLKVEKEAADAKITSLEADNADMKVKLDAFEVKEKEATDAKRETLKTKIPAMAAVFDSADKAAIDTAFDELSKAKPKDLGTVGDGEDDKGAEDANNKKVTGYDRIQNEFGTKGE